MKKSLGALVAIVLIGVAAVPDTAGELHFGLSRSAPEADATVPSPSEIKLWFTQVPREGSLGVRLVDAGGELVDTEDPKADATDAKVVSVRIGHRLTAGSYTVAWRGIGDDGHTVRNEFGFTVSAE